MDAAALSAAKPLLLIAESPGRAACRSGINRATSYNRLQSGNRR
jgi:hypothetical protein